MKKIFFGIFIIFIIIFTALGVYYATSPLSSSELVTDTVEYLVNDKNTFIIRDESVYYSDIDGTLYSHIAEGDRVAKDSTVVTVFSGTISDDNLKELRNIDEKIKRRQNKVSESTVYGDSSNAESKIAEIVDSIAEIGEKNDVLTIGDLKEELNNIRNDVNISNDDILKNLELEREETENRISASKSEIKSDISGVFTTYIDGLEGALKISDVDNYTLASLRSLNISVPMRAPEKSVSKGDFVCKTVNNHVWYAAMAVPSEEAQKHSAGEEVTLRFNEIAGETVKAVIDRISEEDEEDGKRLVIIKCPVYFEGAFGYRCTDVDMIFESYSGYKIPIHAIRSDENDKKYIKARKGFNEYNCYCDIVYTDAQNEFIIIRSSEDAMHKLDDMERIVIGER